MSEESGRSFATLTHARLRAGQGDVAGAVRILRVILEVQPGHHEARAFLAEVEKKPVVAHSEPQAAAAEAVTPATAGDLAIRFREAFDAQGTSRRIRRLSSWLEQTQRQRGDRHV